MSVSFISGKPGGGKSMYSVKLIVDELRLTKRQIVTNVSLKLGELNAYLQREFPHIDCDAIGRVTLMSEAETAKFWLHRGNGIVLEDVSDEEWKKGKRLDFTPSQGGVLYVIDEIHIYFGAREWAQTGKACLYYLSQHRKLGDDVLPVTQSINNVDKQFRSVTQDYTYLRNHAKERIGIFRSLPIFTRATFLEPATGAPGQKAMEYGTFRLDTTGLAACYDTAQGVGIHGRAGADTKERKRGLPFVVLIILLLAAVYVIFTGPEVVFKKLLGGFSSKPSARPVNVQAAIGTNRIPEYPAPVPNPRVPTADGTVLFTNSRAAAVEVPEPIYLSGIAMSRGTVEVFLTNGRKFTSADPELQRVGDGYAIILGRRIDFPPLGWVPKARRMSSGNM